MRWALGFFPAEDPDLFVEDESGSLQGEAHRDCFISALGDSSL